MFPILLLYLFIYLFDSVLLNVRDLNVNKTTRSFFGDPFGPKCLLDCTLYCLHSCFMSNKIINQSIKSVPIPEAGFIGERAFLCGVCMFSPCPLG